MSTNKKVHIKTFGCQMNEHDTEKMYAMLLAKGYEKSDDPQSADLLLVNTCSIREKSHQKALSEVGSVQRRKGKKPIVGVTGCVASQEKEKLMKRFPFIDLVMGTDHLASLPDLMDKVEAGEKVVKADFKEGDEYEFPDTALFSLSPVKAYVTIMKGCDNVCSFCIVPSVRGGEISRDPETIIREVQGHAAQGIKEVILLGQNVNAYGKKNKSTLLFPDLIARVAAETTIERIRFTSPHPQDLSAELIAEYGRNPKLCPHIHLPLQSGSTKVLKKMRRSYTRDVYLRKVEALKKACPAIQISTDVIVGFPGETEKDFEDTLSLLETVRFQSVYSFTYSSRPGTESAAFKETLTEEEKDKRLKILQNFQERIGQDLYQEMIGKTLSVLVEGAARKAGEYPYSGHALGNQIVNFSGDSVAVGDTVSVKVTGASPYSLKGEVAAGEERW